MEPSPPAHRTPAVELVRSLTDEHVLRALMQRRRLTRAELATLIGISKPTAGESVRRLTERGLVVDTGERTPGGRGRGRVGSYYALADTGVALAVSIAPEGIVAESVDAYGDTVARTSQDVPRPAEPAAVAAALTTVARQVGTPRLAVVSAADPVDRATGRLVQLPDAPFLVGQLDPVDIFASYVAGPVIVDNDVNWAARAERSRRPGLDDFAYLYLGEGLGCAIVNDGEVKRGHSGLAGEIAHLITAGPGDHAVRLIEVFAELGLRRPESSAIDVDVLLAVATAQTREAEITRDVVGRAIAGVVAAVVALADPEQIIVGGSWGPALLDSIRAAVARMPRQAPIGAAGVTAEPALAGARIDALERLRASITSPNDRIAASVP